MADALARYLQWLGGELVAQQSFFDETRGFRDTVLARSTRTAAATGALNSNYIGGDINRGIQDLRQLWTRLVLGWPPYATPVAGVYLCSSSTPPGGGVHGMCGVHAAQVVLRRDLRE
jgi:phytoene dehydrogenase-like protein